MSTLEDAFREFATTFIIERQTKFTGKKSTELLTKVAPRQIYDLIPDMNNLRVYGSVGSGSWAEIPWVAILDTDITTSTQKGYYVVFLFDKKVQNVYLCLGLGYMQFEDEYGVSEARTKIQELSRHYAHLLTSQGSTFSNGPLKLNAENNLGKGYELGSVLSRKYYIDDLKHNTIGPDLKEIMGYYKELKSFVGDSVLNLELDSNIYDESIHEFQKEVAKATFQIIDEKAIQALIDKTKNQPRQIREKLVKQIVRNRKVAEFIKRRARYVCSICGREPFIQKNGNPYAEADHIIPIGGVTQGADTLDNVRCICAQCHAVITHGSDEEKTKLFQKPPKSSIITR